MKIKHLLTTGLLIFGLQTAFAQVPVITSYDKVGVIADNVITFSGSHFTGVTSIRFGGVEAASFSIESDNEIKATVGEGSGGIVEIENASLCN